MVVVVVDVNLVMVPLPIAAAVEVVGGDYPVGAIVQNYVARAVIDGARDEYFPDMFVTAARIVPPGNDAVVLVVPAAILVFVPTSVFAVVVASPLVAAPLHPPSP